MQEAVVIGSVTEVVVLSAVVSFVCVSSVGVSSVGVLFVVSKVVGSSVAVEKHL